MSDLLSLFVSCPPHVEPMLADEISEITGNEVQAAKLGVKLQATLEQVYKICLWSRLANKVLVEVGRKSVANVQEIATLSQDCAWEAWFPVSRTLRIDVTGKMPGVKTPLYAVQLIKDGIADRYRQQTGMRPSIDKTEPDVRIVGALSHKEVILYIDFSGGSLHRRGYRMDVGLASLKENLAAALLRKAGFHQNYQSYTTVFDPMCGSGTLLSEAFLMSADIAPGLFRVAMGFERLANYDAKTWNALINTARERRTKGAQALDLAFIGHDVSPKQLAAAQKNTNRLNFKDCIVFKQADLMMGAPKLDKAFVMTNPPYGERLSDEATLKPLYQKISELGSSLGEGSHLSVLSANEKLCREILFKPAKRNSFANGQIQCQLFQFDLGTPYQFASTKKTQLSEGAAMVANRINKNLKKLKKWKSKNAIEAYRVYDADIPEYAAAIDLYGNQVVVQEYKAPKSIPLEKVQRRLNEVVSACASVFEMDADQVVVKQRSVQTRTKKYQKLDKREEYLTVEEYGVKSLVNLHDYLDTGLFLDHRPVRKMIQDRAANKRFLNLFCYTAMATMHAIKGGAADTISVDLSEKYLAWAKNNMRANGFKGKHAFIAEDVLAWLKTQKGEYDLIFIDPPTFSNSKKTAQDFDVQRDHVAMLKKALELLAPEGTIIFSNNFRKFQLDPEISDIATVKEISKQTIDLDFERNQKIHKCWFISHKPS